MEDTVVPIVIIGILIGGPIAAWIVSRVLAHNEYMAMIRMGVTPPPDSKAARRFAKAGWVPPPTPNTWGTTPDAPPGVDPYAQYYAQYGSYAPYYAQFRLGKGIQLTLIGVAFLIGLAFIGYRGGTEFRFGPWLLPGLIVTFVGIAQIINAVISGAHVPGAGSTQVGGPPGGAAQPGQNQGPFSSAAPPAGPPYGWRPGDVPELEKPAQPPDQR
jgi:hypothetical protein